MTAVVSQRQKAMRLGPIGLKIATHYRRAVTASDDGPPE
jgi:hypothetical protein